MVLEKDLEDSQLAMEQREADAEHNRRPAKRKKNLRGKRLREAESHNEQLAASAASATAPLLRQIEALQALERRAWTPSMHLKTHFSFGRLPLKRVKRARDKVASSRLKSSAHG